MIIGKLWGSFKAQMNKLANFFWTADPIAQMQYEYDQAVDQLKGGREGTVLWWKKWLNRPPQKKLAWLSWKVE
jgi:hypothetical protein